MAERNRIAGQHGRAGLAGEERQQQSYGTLPDHEYEFITDDASFVDRFQARVHGLNKGCFLKRDFIRNLDYAALCNPGHDTYVLREAAAVRIESCGEANLFILGAL